MHKLIAILLGVCPLFFTYAQVPTKQVVKNKLEAQNGVPYKIVKNPKHGYFCIDNSDEVIKGFMYEKKVWDRWAFQLYAKYLTKGSVALDIGAHIGVHSLMLSKAVGKKGKVYSFEPQLKIYHELLANLQLNKVKNVSTFNLCISDSNKELYLTEVKPQNEGATQVVNAEDSRATQKVQAITVDSLCLDRVDLMKIDVENHELQVLLGAEATIKRHRPTIVLEIWADHYFGPNGYIGVPSKAKIEALLKSWDYEISAITTDDFLAVPKERI